MRRAFEWLNSKPGLLLCSVLILALAAIEAYSFVQTQRLLYVSLAAVMFTLVVTTWVQLYRHRGDPSWPPKRVLVPRDGS